MSSQSKTPAWERFEINDSHVVRLAHLGGLTVLFCLALLIGWMVVAPVDEVAKARGAIEPEAEVQRLQSEFGGALAVVHVREGNRVAAGDLLASFDQSEFSSDFREARAKKLSLELELERLLALVETREPDFAPIAAMARRGDPDGKELTGGLEKAVVAQLVAREQSAYEARLAFLENKREVIDRQIAAKNADNTALDSELPALQRQRMVAVEQTEMLQSLVDRGLAQRHQLVEAIEAEANFDYQIAVLNGRRAVLDSEISELEQRKEEVGLDFIARARERITLANSELQAVSEQIVRLGRRIAAAHVVSPVAGYVQSVPDTVVGRIIEPGGLVAEIVPSEVALRFAGRLNPRDVGFVMSGQKVNLKIDAFDVSRYGALEGTVVEVSPTTLVDQRGTAYYEVLIDIPEPHFTGHADRFVLLSGMTGEADILTGKKTVFEYIWKPVFTNLDLALTER